MPTNGQRKSQTSRLRRHLQKSVVLKIVSVDEIGTDGSVSWIIRFLCSSCSWHYRRGQYDVTKMSHTDGTSLSVQTLLAPRPLTPCLVGLWPPDARYRQQTRVINWPSRRYPQCIATPTGDMTLAYTSIMPGLFSCALFLFDLLLSANRLDRVLITQGPLSVRRTRQSIIVPQYFILVAGLTRFPKKNFESTKRKLLEHIDYDSHHCREVVGTTIVTHRLRFF